MSSTPGPGNGTHRAQIRKTGEVVTLSLDEDYTSGPFIADYATSRSINTDLSFLDSTNSRLFFGTQAGNTTFDSVTVTVVPEPSTLVCEFAGLLCFGFHRKRR